MKTVSTTSSIRFSRLAYGCWRIAGTWNSSEVTASTRAAGKTSVMAAYEAGFTVFDHADIYCDGEAERLFGEVLRENPAMRRQIVIITKCGVRKPGEPKPDSPYRYDFSAEYIINSCEQSLQRLGIETIDVYLLHRPDYLMDPAEVAAAFIRLKEAGKVREFGVSNFPSSRFVALQKACPMKLLTNQIEISLANTQCLEDGTLDHCLAEKVVPMAWSPLAGGKLGHGAKRLLLPQEAYRTEAVVSELDSIALTHQTNRTAIALAWLLKHPAGIVPIVGSTDPSNIRETARADDIELSRDEWYRLFKAGRGQPLP
jgi:predicted oxidoreductase